MDKRDQINIVLDPATREALNDLRRNDPRLPTVSTVVREALIAAAARQRKSSNGTENPADYKWQIARVS